MNGGAGRGGVGHLGEREQFEDYDWSARYGAGWEMFERQTSRPGAKVARGNYDRQQGLRWKKWRCKMGCDGIADEPETRVCIGVRSGTGLWGAAGVKAPARKTCSLRQGCVRTILPTDNYATLAYRTHPPA